MGKMKAGKLKPVLAGVVSIGGFVLLWYLVSTYTSIGLLIPTPGYVVEAFFRAFVVDIGRNHMLGHIVWSVSRVLVGFCLAAFAGIVIGLLMGLIPAVRAFVMPLFQVLRPIPPIAWISLSILWLGLGESGKYMIIFVAAFPSITVNAFDGARLVDPIVIGAARMLGANRGQVFNTIILPASVPHIFSGLQVAISASWGAVVAAEMISSTQGLGWIIVNAMQINNIGQSLVGMVAIGLVGFLLVSLMRWLEAKLCAWNTAKK